MRGSRSGGMLIPYLAPATPATRVTSTYETPAVPRVSSGATTERNASPTMSTTATTETTSSTGRAPFTSRVCS